MKKKFLCVLLSLCLLLLLPLSALALSPNSARYGIDRTEESALSYSEAEEPDGEPGIPLFQFSLGFLIPILLFGLAGFLGIGLLLALLILIVRFFRRR